MTIPDMQQRIAALAGEYRKQGYAVRLAPSATDFPFDLDYYQPDFLAEKAGEHLLVSVRTPTFPFSISRLRDIADTVRQQPGWRFLFINTGLEPEDSLPPQAPLSWSGIAQRLTQATQLHEAGASEAAVLLFWSGLEALLRRHAEELELPLEHLSVWALLDYLYSDADLSFEHFDQAKKLLPGRNQLAHGFPLPDATQHASQLQGLVDELASEWLPLREAA